jgi:hypothetical protein
MRTFNMVVCSLVLLSMILAATPVKAQKRWSAGAKLGGSGVKLRGDQLGLFFSYPDKFDIRGAVGDKNAGFVGGGFLRYSFSDFFALQGEALYHQKGGKGNVYGKVWVQHTPTTIQEGDITGELTASLDYLELPLLAVFTFPADDRWILTGIAGVAVAFSIDSDVQLQGKVTFPQPGFTSVVIDFDERVDIDGLNRISPVDVGGVIGGGIEVALKRVRLLFDARLTFGLTSADDSGAKNIYNHVFSIFAGAGIPFGSDL